MRKTRFRCHHCKRLYVTRVLGQAYCGDSACQRARRNAWRRTKYESDADYRLNQKSSTADWLFSVGGAAKYHREYRQKKRRVAEQCSKAKTTLKAKEPSNTSLFAGVTAGANTSANSDALLHETPIKSGRYKICPAGANSDAFIAEIRVILDG
jgi:hypothetical protein